MNYTYAISAATDFIKQAEGFKANAYWDSNGYAIGYGNHYYQDGSSVQDGDTITESNAEDLLKYTVGKVEASLRPYVTAKINENQYAALISLTYNCGIGNIENSTLIQLINSEASADDITAQFEKTCVTSNGSYLTVLYNRRVSEVNLFFTSVGQVIAENPNISIITGLTVLALAGYYIYKAAKSK